MSERVTDAETEVLKAFPEGGEWDFGYAPFAYLAKESGLDIKKVRRCCRSLKRKGLATFSSGLWSEDGEPVGSGYAITDKGSKLLIALTSNVEGR